MSVPGLTASTSTGTSAPAYGTTAQTFSDWAGPYGTNMLGQAQAIAQTPYQTYQGPMTAGESGLQSQAFQGLGSLTMPTGLGAAAQTAGSVAQKAGGMGYAPTQFTTGTFSPQEAEAYAPATYAPSTFQTSSFGPTTGYAPATYDSSTFTAGTFGTPEAQQYMNPYLQTALNPQLAEARRQAEIGRVGAAGRLTQAGAYGGGRQAIMEAEGERNLGTQLAGITGAGYNTAYQNAMQQYNADQARQMQAQQATESSKQYGAGYGLNRLQSEMQQFNTDQARQLQAQQAAESSKQYGAGYGLNRLQSATQQFNADQARQLQAQQAGESSRQFGAGYGLSALQQQLAGAQTQGALSGQELAAQQGLLASQLSGGQQQRGIEQEGITADYNEFLAQRDYPMKQTQYLQSMLQGMPIQTVTTSPHEMSGIGGAQANLAGLKALIDQLKGLGIGTSTTPG